MAPSTHAVDVLTLADFDADGALQECAAHLDHTSRRGFLRATGLVAAGGALSALLPQAAWAAGLGKGDKAILNYVLMLEHLQSAFYREALEKGALTSGACPW